MSGKEKCVLKPKSLSGTEGSFNGRRRDHGDMNIPSILLFFESDMKIKVWFFYINHILNQQPSRRKRISHCTIQVCFPFFFFRLDKNPAFGMGIISISACSSDISCSCLLFQGELACLKYLVILDSHHRLQCLLKQQLNMLSVSEM